MCKMTTTKGILASNLVYLVESANLCVISSNIGDLWCL